jgi:hypothetical protein
MTAFLDEKKFKPGLATYNKDGSRKQTGKAAASKAGSAKKASGKVVASSVKKAGKK